MKKVLVYLCMATMLLGYAASADAATGNYANITVDGATADWGSIAPMGTDISGEGIAANVDLRAAYIANNFTTLFTREDVEGTIGGGGTYITYFDTGATGGYNPGWGWALVPKYRLYQDSWSTGLQVHMGAAADDTWGWGGSLYGLGPTSEAHSGKVQEWGTSLANLGLNMGDTFKVCWRTSPGDDSIPTYSTAMEYQVIPEPTSMLLLGSGLLGLIGFARKKK